MSSEILYCDGSYAPFWCAVCTSLSSNAELRAHYRWSGHHDCFICSESNTPQGCELLAVLIAVRIARIHASKHSFIIVIDDIHNLSFVRNHQLIFEFFNDAARPNLLMRAMVSRLIANEICAMFAAGTSRLLFRHRSKTDFGRKPQGKKDLYPPHEYCQAVRLEGRNHLENFPVLTTFTLPALDESWSRLHWPWDSQMEVEFQAGVCDYCLVMRPVSW